MKSRCLNKNDDSYPDYGGRGIIVCDRWLNFENFLSDMGRRPSPQHTIERINNNGNYEPSNCKWATSAEQRLNTRRTVFIEVKGKRVKLQEFAKSLGLNAYMIYARMKNGWTLDEALTIPIKRYKKKAPSD